MDARADSTPGAVAEVVSVVGGGVGGGEGGVRGEALGDEVLGMVVVGGVMMDSPDVEDDGGGCGDELVVHVGVCQWGLVFCEMRCCWLFGIGSFRGWGAGLPSPKA